MSVRLSAYDSFKISKWAVSVWILSKIWLSERFTAETKFSPLPVFSLRDCVRAVLHLSSRWLMRGRSPVWDLYWSEICDKLPYESNWEWCAICKFLSRSREFSVISPCNFFYPVLGNFDSTVQLRLVIVTCYNLDELQDFVFSKTDIEE